MAKLVVVFSQHTPCWGDPPIFRDDNDALEWSVGQGAFADIAGAGRAFAKLGAGADRWARWLGVVAERLNRRSKMG